MRTSVKIAIARIAQRTVTLPRRLLRLPLEVDTRRKGIDWYLDLREGIDFSIWLLGSFEPRTIAAYKRVVKTGAVVFDVGANIGSHTLPLAELVGSTGRVHAFEATAWAFAKLERNLTRNPHLASRVAARHSFLTAGGADPAKEQAIYSSWPLEGGGELHPQHHGRLMAVGEARRCSLDEYANEHALSIDMMKIDVDGHELPVLRGATALLGRCRPTIMIELAPYVCAEAGHTFAELIGLLRDLGYRHAEEIDSGRHIDLDAAGLARRIPTGAGMNALVTA